jgi:hypothetical protein
METVQMLRWKWQRQIVFPIFACQHYECSQRVAEKQEPNLLPDWR